IQLSGTISGTLSASNNYLSSGTMAGDFTVSGTLNWHGGTISGVIPILSGGAIGLWNDNPLILTGTLNNSGYLTTMGNSVAMQLRGQGQVNNQAGGLFSVIKGLNVSGTTNSVFRNAGTLRCW